MKLRRQGSQSRKASGRFHDIARRKVMRREMFQL
jgi:hypothetical protein